MNIRPLTELDLVDWGAYQDAYGPATETPTHLRALLSPEAVQREEALDVLEAALFHQGIAPCEAFLPALPFLLFVLEYGPLEGREPLRDFLREVRDSMGDFALQDGVFPAWWPELARELEVL